MKKVLDYIKPFISIVFGALITLLFLNNLNRGDLETVKSVFAIIVGGYFIVVGLLGLLAPQQIGERPLRLLNSIGISVYAVFFFLCIVLNVADYNAGYGVNGWVVANFALTVSMGFAVLFLLTFFIKNAVVERLARIFGLLFLLALLLNVLFDRLGNPMLLGGIELLKVVTHITFACIYLGTWKE